MQDIKEWWAVIVGVVGLIVWALRVEFSGRANAAEIRRLWHQRDEDLRGHREAREATNEMLREMRDDIRELIKRTAK